MDQSNMNTTAPEGTIETSNPEFNVGDSVLVYGKSAKVLKAVTGKFYQLDSGDGNPSWYAESELTEDENNENPNDDLNEDEENDSGDKWDNMMKMMGMR